MQCRGLARAQAEVGIGLKELQGLCIGVTFGSTRSCARLRDPRNGVGERSGGVMGDVHLGPGPAINMILQLQRGA